MSLQEQRKKEFADLQSSLRERSAAEAALKHRVKVLERDLKLEKSRLAKATKLRRNNQKQVDRFWQRVSAKKSRDRVFVKQNPGKALAAIESPRYEQVLGGGFMERRT